MKWGNSKTKHKKHSWALRVIFAACAVRHASLFLTPGAVTLTASSVRGILQAGILEQVAISYSRGSSRPRDQTLVSYIAGGFLNHCTIWEAHYCPRNYHHASKRLGSNTWYLIATWCSVSDLFFKVILAIITLGKDVCYFVFLINFLFPKQSYSIAEANANPSPLPRFTSNPN